MRIWLENYVFELLEDPCIRNNRIPVFNKVRDYDLAVLQVDVRMEQLKIIVDFWRLEVPVNTLDFEVYLWPQFYISK